MNKSPEIITAICGVKCELKPGQSQVTITYIDSKKNKCGGCEFELNKSNFVLISNNSNRRCLEEHVPVAGMKTPHEI